MCFLHAVHTEYLGYSGRSEGQNRSRLTVSTGCSAYIQLPDRRLWSTVRWHSWASKSVQCLSPARNVVERSRWTQTWHSGLRSVRTQHSRMSDVLHTTNERRLTLKSTTHFIHWRDERIVTELRVIKPSPFASQIFPSVFACNTVIPILKMALTLPETC